MNTIEKNRVAADTSPWSRLFLGQRAVGFTRMVGDRPFFSKDGYGWSGVEIEFDHTAPQTHLRDAKGQRIFEGDLIYTRVHRDTDQMGLRVVLKNGIGQTLFVDPNSGNVQHPEEIWLPPRRPSIASVERSIYEDPSLKEAIEPVRLRIQAKPKTTLSEAIGMGGGIALGIGLAGGLQWMVIGEVGPIMALVGGLIAATMLISREVRQNPKWLKRQRMLKVAVQTGLVLGAILAAVYGGLVAAGIDGLAQSEEGIVLPIIGMGLLGTLAGAILMVVVSDVKAWRSGGYEGEE